MNLCVAFGWSEIAIISSTDSYGSGLAQTISDAATSAGVTVAANVAVDLTSTDITAGIKEIQAAGARILVVVIETDEWATVQTSMQKVGYSPSAVVASDWLLGAGSAYIVEATGYNLVRVRISPSDRASLSHFFMCLTSSSLSLLGMDGSPPIPRVALARFSIGFMRPPRRVPLNTRG